MSVEIEVGLENARESKRLRKRFPGRAAKGLKNPRVPAPLLALAGWRCSLR